MDPELDASYQATRSVPKMVANVVPPPPPPPPACAPQSATGKQSGIGSAPLREPGADLRAVVDAGDHIDFAGRRRERRCRPARADPIEVGAVAQRPGARAVLRDDPLIARAARFVRGVCERSVSAQRHSEDVPE